MLKDLESFAIIIICQQSNYTSDLLLQQQVWCVSSEKGNNFK